MTHIAIHKERSKHKQLDRTRFAAIADFYKMAIELTLDPQNRSALRQYMRPVPMARFMASLFTNTTGDVKILDPNVGIGSLTAAFVERLCQYNHQVRSITIAYYRIEPLIISCLRNILYTASELRSLSQIEVIAEIRLEDFLLSKPELPPTPLLEQHQHTRHRFTHTIIINPPYKKITSSSKHRIALRKTGIETTKLYAGFLFLAANCLRLGGELVAIVPKSFCNGPYSQAFRKWFFETMALRRIHICEKRDIAFGRDGVLQEHLILNAIKGSKSPTVEVTISYDGNFRNERTQRGIGLPMTKPVISSTTEP